MNVDRRDALIHALADHHIDVSIPELCKQWGLPTMDEWDATLRVYKVDILATCRYLAIYLEADNKVAQ